MLIRHRRDFHQALELETGAVMSEAGMREVPGKAL